MNEDQVKGTLEKAKGNVKEAAGKLVGNESLEAEGRADQVSGAVQRLDGGCDGAPLYPAGCEAWQALSPGHQPASLY